MPSFDVVSEVDMVEVRNAVDQANREIGARFDFKGSDTRIEQTDTKLVIQADDEFKLGQARDILEAKLAKRGVDLGSLDYGKIEKAGGDTVRQDITVRQGIDGELARRIVKLIKDAKLKVQASIQGDQIRVSGKKRDDLQTVIAMLRKQDLGLPLQYTNFRD
jgi:uncharacterized protein YajQ (UPF0234 family)